MSGVRLIEAKPEDLCPTQLTVGYDEVAFKRENWKALNSEEKSRFLAGHPFPAVAGPNHRYYILDGHHLGRAFLEEGVEAVYLCPVEDFSHLDRAKFWQVMEWRNLVYPYALGQRCDFEDFPETLRDLADDPFRSLVAKVHRACRYGKDSTPFAEFHAAEFLRSHISFRKLKAYPKKVFSLARELLRKRASSARLAHPACYGSSHSCKDCDATAMPMNAV